MTKTKLLLGSLGLCAALAAGGALAQTGGTVPGAMPPDTSAPSRDPSPPPTDAANLGGNSGDKAGSSVTQHKHKKARKSTSQTPKPADNDNNATPNTPK